MRNPIAILLLPAMLAACTFALPKLTQFTGPATLVPPPVRLPTEVVRSSDTPSFTPTVPTSTFTLTPTLVAIDTTPGESITPTLTATIIQLVQGSVLTETSYVKGFVSIILSAPVVYWGESSLSKTPCGPSGVTVTAQVSEPTRVVNVSLFLRLKSKMDGGATDWDSGRLMINRGNGTFTSTIESNTLTKYPDFRDGWIHLQLVSLDGKANIIDRTPVFAGNLSLAVCP